METHRPVLRLIKIRDGNCYLNADPEKPIPLSHEWKVGDLLSRITAYASEYEVDIIDERHVQTIINRAVLELGNGKDKVNNLLLDKDAPEAEKKGLQMFKFRPTAKLTYSCNIPPKPPLNVDDSFYRRWILIKCAWRETDYFTGTQRTRDRKILDKLATPENLSGLLNLVIISAHRLLKRERFCREQPTDEIRAEYDRMSNPVKLWTEECCEEVDDDEPDACVTKQEAHANYIRFCKTRNIAPLNEVWLGKELSALGYTERQLGKGRGRKRVLNGLKLKEVTGRASFPSLIEGQTSLVEQGKDPLPVTSQEEP